MISNGSIKTDLAHYDYYYRKDVNGDVEGYETLELWLDGEKPIHSFDFHNVVLGDITMFITAFEIGMKEGRELGRNDLLNKIQKWLRLEGGQL